MKIQLDGGQIIDTNDHKCAGPPSCVFCKMNDQYAKEGYYVIPFDIPDVYDRTQKPHVKIVRLQRVHIVGEDE